MHQKEKDRFYLQTGFQPEQISKYMRQQNEAESRKETIAALAKQLEAKKMSVTKVIASGKDDFEEDDDWEDEDDKTTKSPPGEAKKGKTVTLE